MAKERTAPCIYYECAGADCKKGRKNVLHSEQCQTCKKYCPRKTGNKKTETVREKRDKAGKKDAIKRMREW